MTTRELQRRLTAIERDLASLKDRAEPVIKAHPATALEKIHGTFEDDDAFREAVRLGRKWRASDRQSGRGLKARKK